MSVPNKSKTAATVILLRPAGSTGFEVLLTRRPAAMTFLGGMYGFPGANVRREDYSSFMLTRCRGLSPDTARRITGARFTAQEALGFWIAAIRGLFDETGILLAVDDCDRPVISRSEHRGGPGEECAPLIAPRMNFYRLLKTEGLFCDASRLVYFTHWQTCARFGTRFDTYFFLAVLPHGQHVLATAQEVEDNLWLPPDRSLQLFQHEKLPMIFPTFASLRILADFATLEGVLREFSMRTRKADDRSTGVAE
jgi:8-oxo-dGTP pyrophosphatase MutT (NUDIX family)